MPPTKIDALRMEIRQLEKKEMEGRITWKEEARLERLLADLKEVEKELFESWQKRSAATKTTPSP